MCLFREDKPQEAAQFFASLPPERRPLEAYHLMMEYGCSGSPEALAGVYGQLCEQQPAARWDANSFALFLRASARTRVVKARFICRGVWDSLRQHSTAELATCWLRFSPAATLADVEELWQAHSAEDADGALLLAATHTATRALFNAESSSEAAGWVERQWEQFDEALAGLVLPASPPSPHPALPAQRAAQRQMQGLVAALRSAAGSPSTRVLVPGDVRAAGPAVAEATRAGGVVVLSCALLRQMQYRDPRGHAAAVQAAAQHPARVFFVHFREEMLTACFAAECWLPLPFEPPARSAQGRLQRDSDPVRRSLRQLRRTAGDSNLGGLRKVASAAVARRPELPTAQGYLGGDSGALLTAQFRFAFLAAEVCGAQAVRLCLTGSRVARHLEARELALITSVAGDDGDPSGGTAPKVPPSDAAQRPHRGVHFFELLVRLPGAPGGAAREQEGMGGKLGAVELELELDH